MKGWVRKIQRGLKASPQVVVKYLIGKLRNQAEIFLAPRRVAAFKRGALLRATGYSNLDRLWDDLGNRLYLTAFGNIDSERARADDAAKYTRYDDICPGDRERIIEAAQKAMRGYVNLLGSGPVHLGNSIDWHQDYKTGVRWTPDYFRKIDYINPGQPSDVKFPWELSRMQWLIPVGQAYFFTGDEEYAIKVREILEDWMEQNPYAGSVNWACAMEVALRIYTWTWFFHAFWKSQAWREPGFRLRFLSCLFLHGDFTARHLEWSDINGNHYTADAAGLVAAGLFFGSRGNGNNCRKADHWSKLGWKILTEEMKQQVYPDGVDFEMSVAYHRLVLELFLLPALYRKACGLPIAADYRERLIAMTRFTAAYSRQSSSAPLWGDSDDGRVLPFGGQSINDHRYLIGLAAMVWGVDDLIDCFSGARAEIVWLLGLEQAAKLPDLPVSKAFLDSQAFPDAGFYIMRNDRDHVFIDCGPVGLAGRGGHGHNDCLSFEAVLDGTELVTDCGAYVYTASYEERNFFRSTACHNTPQVDELEINRFIHPDYLWSLQYDARPLVKHWEKNSLGVVFSGSHHGYQRLPEPVFPERTLILDHQQHLLVIRDRFSGQGRHSVKIPLHLAPGVEVQLLAPGRLSLHTGGRYFWLNWYHPGNWEFTMEPARISPSYGVIRPSVKLIWQRQGALDKSLTILLRPADKRNEIGFERGWITELMGDTGMNGDWYE